MEDRYKVSHKFMQYYERKSVNDLLITEFNSYLHIKFENISKFKNFFEHILPVFKEILREYFKCINITF